MQLSRRGLDVELCAKTMTFLLRCHLAQLSSSRTMRDHVDDLGSVLKQSMRSYQQALGSNLAGLKFLTQFSNDSKFAPLPEPQVKRSHSEHKSAVKKSIKKQKKQ